MDGKLKTIVLILLLRYIHVGYENCKTFVFLFRGRMVGFLLPNRGVYKMIDPERLVYTVLTSYNIGR